MAQLSIAAQKTKNARRWDSMVVDPAQVAGLDATAKKIVAAKSRYLVVENKTGVPWFIIGVIHVREADQSWKANLAQGDPWDQVSIHVPKGRGPFKSWEDAAVDALKTCEPRAALWKDWSTGGALTLLESYNGYGYAKMGRPSPYVWAATNQYKIGKYVADGHYDPDVVDKQPGCAALISRMMLLDKSVRFDGPIVVAPPVPNPSPVNETARPMGAFDALVVSYFERFVAWMRDKLTR